MAIIIIRTAGSIYSRLDLGTGHARKWWTYISALAYIVDANAVRSSTAVTTNSAFRGIIPFISIDVAIP
ncbi:hypothetical protein FIBSPDRAFT_862892 [Athelia psychrophila]|uniref:Uncharacterized protein n=1 Tax=Athelia psychrophila TaxID=1759441 RepID=A0A166HUS8_9AGAM|nr:hypothetical protein FIBSPDRAFT_862892 [Fibularhizoctonia sp. CBS 109695]